MCAISVSQIFKSASSLALAASLRLFTLSHSQIRRLADLHFCADLCPRCAILTSCNLCMSMIGTSTYFYLPMGGFYGKICTRPTSCEFDLKSATCSQMTKRTSCDLSSATCSQMTQRELPATCSRQK